MSHYPKRAVRTEAIVTVVVAMLLPTLMALVVLAALIATVNGGGSW
jgi:hypothetical protein